MRVAPALAALIAAAPALAEPAPEPPPEAVVGVLPFETSDEPNRVMVNLAPEGGRPFVMLLDTGASDSVMTPLMARQLGVRVRKQKSDPYRRSTRLGSDLRFWIDTRRSDTGSATGWEYGLLGAEFLNDFVLEIDFAGRSVRFLDPQQYQVPDRVDAGDERVVPVQMTSSRPLVPVELNGRHVHVLLDTGDPGPGVISGKLAREVGVDVGALPEFGSVGTVVGAMQARLHEEKSFGFAGFALGEVPLLVAPKGWYNQTGPNDSTVGYDVLSQFVIRIDYPRKRLWLKRATQGPVTFVGADYGLARRTGAFMRGVRGGWEVFAVVPDSPAEKLGVRVGDVIVSPAGASAPPADEVLRRILAGEELQVARRRGELWVDTVLPEAEATN